MKRKKAFIIVASVFAVLCIVLGAGLYIARPKNVYAEYTVCSAEGETKEVILDVTVHKRWFVKKKLLAVWKLTGTITFDGTEYVDPYGVYNKNHELWKEGGAIQFVVPTLNLIELQQKIDLNMKNEDLEAISLLVDDGSRQVFYFGPADTVEKQKEISDDMVNNGESWIIGGY